VIVIAVVALALIALLISAIFIVEIWRGKPSPMANLGVTFLGVVYVALPVSLIA
jgi:hypothetical protein